VADNGFPDGRIINIDTLQLLSSSLEESDPAVFNILEKVRQARTMRGAIANSDYRRKAARSTSLT
jgi:hypothetical protein